MSHHNNRNLTLHYSLVELAFWMNFAVVISFPSVYLLEYGYTNTQIGLLAASANLLSACAQPVLAAWADKKSSPSIRIIAMALAGIMAVFSVCLILCRQNGLLSGLFWGLNICLLQLSLPFLNSLGTETMRQGKKLNYGLCRGLGSLSYAIIVALLGRLNDAFGTFVLPVSMFLIYLCIFFSLLAFPFEKTILPEQKEEAVRARSGGLLRRYAGYLLVLAGCLLLYTGHTVLNNYCFQIAQYKGGGSTEMGQALSLSAMTELPVMFGFFWLLKKKKAAFWFNTGALFFTIRLFAITFAPNWLLFYAGHCLQFLGFGLFTVSSVYYVSSVMDPEDAIKGQSWLTMVLTGGGVIGSLLGGTLLDSVGVISMMLIAGALSTIGSVIVIGANYFLPIVRDAD